MPVHSQTRSVGRGAIKADIMEVSGREYLFHRPTGAFRQHGDPSDGADPITDTKTLSVHGALLASATIVASATNAALDVPWSAPRGVVASMFAGGAWRVTNRPVDSLA